MLDVDITLSRDSSPIRAQFRLNQKSAGLFGPSGAGKSRLLKCLAGHCSPDWGYVSLDGEVLFDSRNRINRLSEDGLIALCSQGSPLDATRTVRENLLDGESQSRAPRPYFALPDIAQLLALTELLRFRARNLSAGERQRVVLGKALLSSPKVLLLDDMLSAIEQTRREKILDLLRFAIEKHGLRVVQSSHALGELLHLSDVLILMSGGKVLASGFLSELAREQVPLHTAGLSTVGNILPVTILSHDSVHGCTLGRFFGLPLILPYTPLAHCGSTYYVSLRPSDIALSTQPVKGISIQNQIKGRVCAVIPREDRVVIQIDVGTTLIAEITRRAFAAMNIGEGDTVYCLAKTQAFSFLAADMISDCSAAARRLLRTAKSAGLNGHSFHDVGGIGQRSRHDWMQRWPGKNLRKL
ncbi:molybdenum ABC transporter ATP-binding protein [Methylocaldum szegediense]|jgi:molybdate transport system ATP-binding protein|uniref:Molybdate ABC transporter, ATPase subunit n=1 Tax=Methylocaldum szegediense TaxID=73780 RepID=A0ABM9I253_9GAMM|nr:ATP-binding cassette domain-containing protein [Methylocaldum szegediense]CAI8842642.1 Molybdate ABC transporter, ATPase subunit [Methylocaldum szegediense]